MLTYFVPFAHWSLRNCFIKICVSDVRVNQGLDCMCIPILQGFSMMKLVGVL